MFARPLELIDQSQTSALIIGDIDGLSLSLEKLLSENNVALTKISFEDIANNSPTASALLKSYSIQEFDYIYYLEENTSTITATLMNLFTDSPPSRFIHISSLLSLAPFRPKETRNYKSIRVGEFYGKNSLDNSIISRLITDGLTKKNLTIPGDGLTQINPTYIDDIARGIILATISPYVRSGEIVLINPTSTSILNLAYKIRALLPSKVDISFDENLSISTPNVDWTIATHTQDTIGWQPEILLDEGLKNAVLWAENNREELEIRSDISEELTKPITSTTPEAYTPPQTPDFPTPRPKLTPLIHEPLVPIDITTATTPDKKPPFISRIRVKRQRKQKKPKHVEFVKSPDLKKKVRKFHLSSLAITIISLLGFYSFSILLALVLVAHSAYSLSHISSPSDLETSSFSRSIKFFSSSYLKSNLSLVNSLTGGQSRRIADLSAIIDATSLLYDTMPDLHQIHELSGPLADHFLGTSTVNLTETISLLMRELDTVYTNVSLAYGLLPDIPPSFLPASYHEQYSEAKARVGDFNNAIFKARTIIPALPTLLAIDSSTKYLILLQNNMELRPTGGFIGSFALADLQSGKLDNLEVYDVYSADGQLDGYVEPPGEIEAYLGEDNWYLRDSNWDPDFPTSARRVEWFLSKTLGDEVSGTIAINLFTIQDIIRELGPITLPDYQEEITADNLFERAEFHSEIDFFPGSTQKKEFLASLTDAIFIKLKQSDEETMFKVLSAIFHSLETKNTLISHLEPSTASAVSKNGWSGSVLSSTCPSTVGECYQDSLMINEANVGINKANYFIERSARMEISVLPARELDHTLTITHTNTATSHTWPAGNYKNYSRLYLPRDITDLEISVGGTKLASRDFTRDLSDSHTIIGYLMTVPITETVDTVVSYTTTDKIATDNSTYHFFWQKQPGTFPHDISLRFNYPLYLEPSVTSEGAELNQGFINFPFTNERDTHIFATFNN